MFHDSDATAASVDTHGTMRDSGPRTLAQNVGQTSGIPHQTIDPGFMAAQNCSPVYPRGPRPVKGLCLWIPIDPSNTFRHQCP